MTRMTFCKLARNLLRSHVMSLLDTAEIPRLKIFLNKGRLPNTKEIKAEDLAEILPGGSKCDNLYPQVRNWGSIFIVVRKAVEILAVL